MQIHIYIFVFRQLKAVLFVRSSRNIPLNPCLTSHNHCRTCPSQPHDSPADGQGDQYIQNLIRLAKRLIVALEEWHTGPALPEIDHVGTDEETCCSVGKAQSQLR